MVNLRHRHRRARDEAEIVDFVERARPATYLREELERFRDGRAEGSWENFLYFGARLFYEAQPEDGPELGAPPRERARGRRHAPLEPRPRCASRAQVIELDTARPGGRSTRGSGRVDAERLARAPTR